MDEATALSKMIAPGTRRPGKFREGVIQIMVTRACDKSCFACTQGSNLGGKTEFMSPERFEQAIKSLGFGSSASYPNTPASPQPLAYFGVVGVFGGNPALSPHFGAYCEILKKHVPYEQRGLWCNHPKGKGKLMRGTFNPAVSNLNVHLDKEAYAEFRRDWPEAHPFGLDRDSRHSPPFVAMKDVLNKPCPTCTGPGRILDSGNEFKGHHNCPQCHGTGRLYDESRAWELISKCDINQHWSALIGVFRGELRAFFCEIAYAQAALHQHEPDYPDTGLIISQDGWHYGKYDKYRWWELGMNWFADQVRKHCHECSVPLNIKGELSQSTIPESKEQVSATHADVYKPKRVGRRVELVTVEAQVSDRGGRVIDYLKNGA